MDRGRVHAFALQLRDELVGAALGAHEHHRARHAGRDRGEHLDAVELVHLQEAVQHLVDGLRRRRRLRASPGRACSGAPARRPRGRAWPRTAASGGRREPCASIHSTCGRKPMSAMRSASSMMRMRDLRRGRARRARAGRSAGPGSRPRLRSCATEVADLAFHRRAAVERGDAHADRFADRAQHVDDLLGELAGRHEHERSRVAGLRRTRRSATRAGRTRASCPSRSWPCRTRRARRVRLRWWRPGSAKGSSMPWAARASTISALRPRSRNVVTFLL